MIEDTTKTFKAFKDDPQLDNETLRSLGQAVENTLRDLMAERAFRNNDGYDGNDLYNIVGITAANLKPNTRVYLAIHKSTTLDRDPIQKISSAPEKAFNYAQAHGRTFRKVSLGEAPDLNEQYWDKICEHVWDEIKPGIDRTLRNDLSADIKNDLPGDQIPKPGQPGSRPHAARQYEP